MAVLGVTQEQHPDRCRLFAQWQGFDWPILHDPINLMEAPAVPIVVAIDEHGIVRAVGPDPETFEADFLDRTFDDDAGPASARSPGPPDPEALRVRAEASPSADAWRAVGDALTVWRGPDRASDAIDAYERALKIDPDDKLSVFRLGVAHRVRHESAGREPGDFRAAVGAWGRALELDPNQYIWRRRIEQYGPRLAKPYPFYDWVAQARDEVRDRGETPVALALEPYGSEIASPAREVVTDRKPPAEPDPKGRIRRDDRGLIEAEVVVVPAKVSPGGAARAHLTFRPNRALGAHWNNESTPLQVWVNAPDGWAVDARLLEAPPGPPPESDEVRRLDFEVKAPPGASGKARLTAYALYNTCEEAGGQCLFLRRDITVEVDLVD